jgi:hypothetical protein
VTTAPLVAGVQKAHKELIASYSAPELDTILDFLTRFVQNVKEHAELIEKDPSQHQPVKKDRR